MLQFILNSRFKKMYTKVLYYIVQTFVTFKQVFDNFYKFFVEFLTDNTWHEQRGLWKKIEKGHVIYSRLNFLAHANSLSLSYTHTRAILARAPQAVEVSTDFSPRNVLVICVK